MGVISRAKLAVQNAQFKLWQWRHPGATFKDYFGEVVSAHVKQGRSHPTLGEHLHGGKFGEFGQDAFNRIVKFGLLPDDVCVDYGCGTLRVGVHFIRHLNRGNYWGLDIHRSLLDEGARLIGEKLMSEKEPHLCVLSPSSVGLAAEAKPKLLFSIAVLIHVHPDELEEYFRNIVAIIGRSGRAIMTGKWSTGKTEQLALLSWAHSLPFMTELVDRLGARLSVLSQEDRKVKHLTTKAGMLEISAKV
jgi:hypothetical protein